MGSCEDRACNYFEKEGKSFFAGHKILLTGIQVVYTREYACTRWCRVYSEDICRSDIKSTKPCIICHVLHMKSRSTVLYYLLSCCFHC